jgi:hypothetical protein
MFITYQDLQPDTPATVQHLRAVVAESDSALPARGLLVTTFVYIRTYRSPTTREPILVLDENPDVAITGPLELLTGPILNQATAVALGHRTWLRGWEQHRSLM